MKRSTRSPDELRAALERWLAGKVRGDVAVAPLETTSASGMSSETLLFDATVDCRVERLVARLAPQEDDLPVFPTYDLAGQARLISLVGGSSDVPVPKVRWAEPDPSHLGTPFFVMGRVDGRVPPDVMPYTFGDNWLFDASHDEQRALQDASVSLLARLHGLDASQFAFLGRRSVAGTRDWYEFVVAAGGGERSAVIDDAFGWLEANEPARGRETDVLVWGDARIGNVLYESDGFGPVAVLDWEMAGVGARELDVAWMVMAHMVFEHLASSMGMEGMPHFMRAEDVVEVYERSSGVRLGDLRFALAYAAVQWAVVFVRTGQRRVHFGEQERPATVDDYLMHRGLLAEVLA